MGCDIHMFAEHQEPGRDEWESFAGEQEGERDYLLFGYLAGVRGDGPPVVEPRDRPRQTGWEEKEAWGDRGPGHTASWVTADEFQEALDKTDTDRGALGTVGDEYRALLAALRYLESKGHAVRVVFWFDN